MATAAAANESRSELLSWVNELLQLNVTKIESIGTGAVLCQIMDSIYGDVQMHKVKFNTNQEYEFVGNFKALQTCFNQHAIDKVVVVFCLGCFRRQHIPVERLIKLKFQDNLVCISAPPPSQLLNSAQEFLQWVKKFWDSNYPGGHYDAVGRRKGTSVGAESAAQSQRESTGSLRHGALRASASANNSHSNASLSSASGAGAAHATKSHATGPQRLVNNAQHSPPHTPNTTSQMQHSMALLNKTITELRLTVDEMEKERDFYFNKLRDIEVVTQKTTDPVLLNSDLFRQVTEILYKTESGFEIPEGGDASARGPSAEAVLA